jgi:hypothetical protein
MTPQQFERWKDFAFRMCDKALELRLRPSRAWVKEKLEDFFSGLTPQDVAKITDWDSDPYPCDMLSEASQYWNPFYWGGEAQDEAFHQFEEQWEGPVRCCIRAGLDVASAPSAGVVGFTIGDLRRMYPEGLPDWVTAFIIDPSAPISLESIPDHEGVWL